MAKNHIPGLSNSVSGTDLKLGKRGIELVITKQLSLNVMAVTFETAVQECSTTQSCGAYHICGQRHKNCACVFIWGSHKHGTRQSRSKGTFLCLCPWMWYLLKSLSDDSLHLRGRCKIKLHLAVEILNILCILRTEKFCRQASAQPFRCACQHGGNF